MGAAANTPGGAGGGATSAQNSNNNSKKNKVTAYEINKTVSETVKTAGNLKSISAAVFIAKKHDKGPTTTAPVNRTPQEIEILKKMVVNALGADAKDAEQRVTVEEMAFDQPDAAADAKKSGLAVAGSPVEWLDMGRRAVAVIAAIGIFVFFMGMLKKQKTEASSIEILEEKTGAQTGPMVLTPEVLNTLIQQKPDNVSAALKSWVSGAGPAKR